jgi:phage-related protein
MAGLTKKELSSFQDSLHILTTQVETINQQLAGGTGGGTSPVLANNLRDISSKVTYLYQGLQTMQNLMKAESQGVVVQVGALLKQGFDKQLTDVAAKLGQLQQNLGAILQALRSSPAINAQDLVEIKKTIHDLAAIYKEEAEVFRRQNEFLQRKLTEIEAKLSKK